MAVTPWFAGVCDTLLGRIDVWINHYEKGQVYATRQFMTESFEKIDLPVQYVHDVPFSLAEMTHLVRILTAEAPKERFTEDFRNLLAVIKNPMRMRQLNRMVRQASSGHFVIALTFEKAELVKLLEILSAVKAGRKPADSSVDALVAQKKKAGKGLWE